MTRRDYRSAEAAEWRKLYKTSAWQQLRAAQLAREPLCRACKAMGIVTVATVVDHREAHKGERAKFYDPTNLQSMCKPHHDSAGQSKDRTGKAIRVTGADGWPVEV